MKIYTDAKTLENTLKALNWSGKPSIATLEFALLTAKDEGIRITRTNLDLFLTLKVPGEVQEPGQCLIPVKKALAVLKNCKGEVPLELDGEFLKLGTYVLDSFPAENYPAQPDGTIESIGTVQGYVLDQAIKKCASWLYGLYGKGGY